MEKIKGALNVIKEESLLALIVVLFFTFIFSINRIPSDSMATTIGVENRIFVSMLPYYFRMPERGEIVVFNGPDGKKWIKRVIGLPGETVDIIDGNVYIDNKKLDELAYLTEEGNSGLDPHIQGITLPYTVPKNSYFLMGDNRMSSHDCRYIGAIEGKEITGKALFKIFPFDQFGVFNQE